MNIQVHVNEQRTRVIRSSIVATHREKEVSAGRSTCNRSIQYLKAPLQVELINVAISSVNIFLRGIRDESGGGGGARFIRSVNSPRAYLESYFSFSFFLSFFFSFSFNYYLLDKGRLQNN